MKKFSKISTYSLISLLILSALGIFSQYGAAVTNDEPNNGVTSANPIATETQYLFLSNSGGDSDYFNVTLQGGKNYCFNINPDTTGLYLNVRIYNTTSNELLSAYVDHTQMVDFNVINAETGQYTIFVVGDEYGVYVIEVSEIQDDIYEEDDNFNSANLLYHSIVSNLILLDTDCFSFYVPKDTLVSVKTLRDTTYNSNSLTLNVYDSSYSQLDSDSNPNGTVEFTATSSGIYYAKVIPQTKSVGEKYQFTYNFNDEPNDDISQAIQIEKGYHSGYSTNRISGREYDFFKIALTAGQILNVSIGNFTSTDMFLEIYMIYESAPGIVDQSSESEFTTRKADWVALDSSFHYIAISSNLDTRYTLNIVVNDPSGNQGNSDDSYEENDVIDQAQLMAKGTYTNLRLIDDDFFKFSVNSGENITITVVRQTTSNTMPTSISISGPNRGTLHTHTTINYTYRFTASETGVYYLTVKAGADYSTADVNYTVSLSITPSSSGNNNGDGDTNNPDPAGIDGFSPVLLSGFSILGIVLITKTKRKQLN